MKGNAPLEKLSEWAEVSECALEGGLLRTDASLPLPVLPSSLPFSRLFQINLKDNSSESRRRDEQTESATEVFYTLDQAIAKLRLARHSRLEVMVRVQRIE